MNYDAHSSGDEDRIALIRADRQPPFTSREALVRVMATSYPAHTLDQSMRRAAARDSRLEWRPGEGRYGYRRGAASPVQPVDTPQPLNCAPAPSLGDLGDVEEASE